MVLLNQQRVFLPFSTDPCNIDSVWHWALHRILSSSEAERGCTSHYRKASRTVAELPVKSWLCQYFWWRKRACVSHEFASKILISQYPDIIVAFLQHWFLMLDFESDISQWKGTQRKGKNSGSKTTMQYRAWASGFAKCVWESCGGCSPACHSWLSAQRVEPPLCSWGIPQWVLPGGNWSLRNVRSCFKLWACSQQPWKDKRDLKPGRAAPPLRLPHSPHPKGNSFYYEKSASEFANVANQVSRVWRKQNSLSGQWICFAISKFSILPWFLDISLCWRKQIFLLLVWGKEEYNKMNFRN